jgi:hypothetical protein
MVITRKQVTFDATTTTTCRNICCDDPIDHGPIVAPVQDDKCGISCAPAADLHMCIPAALAVRAVAESGFALDVDSQAINIIIIIAVIAVPWMTSDNPHSDSCGAVIRQGVGSRTMSHRPIIRGPYCSAAHTYFTTDYLQRRGRGGGNVDGGTSRIKNMGVCLLCSPSRKPFFQSVIPSPSDTSFSIIFAWRGVAGEGGKQFHHERAKNPAQLGSAQPSSAQLSSPRHKLRLHRMNREMVRRSQ